MNGTGNGVVMQPGQVEIKKGTEDSEIRPVLRRTFWLIVCCNVVLAVLVADALVIGPLSGYVVGWLAVVALAVLTVIYSRNRIAQAVVVMSVAGAWLTVGWDVVLWLWPPLALAWPVWAKTGVLMASLAVGGPVAALGVHLLIAIWDPNYPAPRQALDRTRPVMPWTREPDELEETATPPAPAPDVEYVRPVPVHHRGQTHAIDGNSDNGANPSRRQKRRVLVASDGSKAPVELVRDMITAQRDAYTYWKGRSAGEAEISAAKLILEEHGILRRGADRQPSEWLMEPEQALDVLRAVI